MKIVKIRGESSGPGKHQTPLAGEEHGPSFEFPKHGHKAVTS